MKKIKYIELIMLLLVVSVSFIFTFKTNFTFGFQHSTTLMIYIFSCVLTIVINLNKNIEYKKIIKFLKYLLLVIIFFHIVSIIRSSYNIFSLDLEYNMYYLIIISITLINVFFNLKKDTKSINSLLTISVCFIILFVHFRFYFEPKFVHNLMNLDHNNIISQNSFVYLEQYYKSFILMFIILNINNYISKIKNISFKFLSTY